MCDLDSFCDDVTYRRAYLQLLKETAAKLNEPVLDAHTYAVLSNVMNQYNRTVNALTWRLWRKWDVWVEASDEQGDMEPKKTV